MAEKDKPTWKGVALELQSLVYMFDFQECDCANCSINNRMRVSMLGIDEKIKELA